MKLPPGKTNAFTLPELVITIVVIAVLLIVIVVPNLSNEPTTTPMSETLTNARTLQQAIQAMTLDHQKSGDGIQWTMTVSDKGASPVSVSELCTALTANGYMTRDNLRQVLTAPGSGPGKKEPTAENICFKIFEAGDESPSNQVLLTTRNISPPTGGLEADSKPYGTEGFVYFTKSGQGAICTNIPPAGIGRIFPSGKNAEGLEYRYVTLK